VLRRDTNVSEELAVSIFRVGTLTCDTTIIMYSEFDKNNERSNDRSLLEDTVLVINWNNGESQETYLGKSQLGRIILKWMLKEQDMKVDSTCVGYCQVIRSCEYGNEPSSYIKENLLTSWMTTSFSVRTLLHRDGKARNAALYKYWYEVDTDMKLILIWSWLL